MVNKRSPELLGVSIAWILVGVAMVCCGQTDDPPICDALGPVVLLIGALLASVRYKL